MIVSQAARALQRHVRHTCAGAVLLAGSVGASAQLTLHQAIQLAMNSPQTQAAQAQVAEVQGDLRQAGLGLNPRLFLQSEDWRPWGSDFDYGTQTENYGYLSQTFETGGKRSRRVALAEAQLREAHAGEQLTLLALASRVASAYWNAAVLEKTTALLKEDMTAVDEMVRYHQERVAAGAMRGVDLLRMQIERDRLAMALQSTEREAAQARLELFKQMGRPVDDTETLSDPLEAMTTVDPVPAATVLAQRPDLIRARDAVATAEANVRLQRANAVPDLDLLGGYKRNGANNTGYGSLQIPLAFRNRNQGGIERAQAAVQYAQSNLQAMELQARAEVAQAEAGYQQQREIVTALLPDMRARAKQNLQLMTEAYRIGGVDLLRFLDAERTEFEVEGSALRAYADFQQAALRLRLIYGEQP